MRDSALSASSAVSGSQERRERAEFANPNVLIPAWLMRRTRHDNLCALRGSA